MREEYLIVKGASLYFEIHGEGEPLILLHGNGESHKYFRYQIGEFSRDYQVIAIDTRAHGKSSRGAVEELDFTVLAQDVIAVMDYLHISKAHILGFSDGGNTALHLAVYHPERLRSLILNGANLYPYGIKPQHQIPIDMGYIFLKILAYFSSGLALKKEIAGLMVNHPHISRQQLRGIQIPCLVIVGEYDMVKDVHSKMIAANLPHSRLKVLEGGSHFIAAKRYRQFNNEVAEFLASIKKISHL